MHTSDTARYRWKHRPEHCWTLCSWALVKQTISAEATSHQEPKCHNWHFSNWRSPLALLHFIWQLTDCSRCEIDIDSQIVLPVQKNEAQSKLTLTSPALGWSLNSSHEKGFISKKPASAELFSFTIDLFQYFPELLAAKSNYCYNPCLNRSFTISAQSMMPLRKKGLARHSSPIRHTNQLCPIYTIYLHCYGPLLAHVRRLAKILISFRVGAIKFPSLSEPFKAFSAMKSCIGFVSRLVCLVACWPGWLIAIDINYVYVITQLASVVSLNLPLFRWLSHLACIAW